MEYYRNVRMFYHFQLYICIEWKFNLFHQLSGQDLHHGYLAGRPPRLHLPRPRHRRRQQPKSQAVFYEDFHNLRWQIRVAVVGLQVVIASQPTL